MTTENTDNSGSHYVDNAAGAQKIPVIQEQLVVDTKWVETGSLLITKHVYEEQAQFEGIAARDEVTVERKQINQIVETAPPAVRQEGDVTIISVVKEVLVIEKRLMLVEEVHVSKHQYHDRQTVSETLRKEEVTISRNASGTDL